MSSFFYSNIAKNVEKNREMLYNIFCMSIFRRDLK